MAFLRVQIVFTPGEAVYRMECPTAHTNSFTCLLTIWRGRRAVFLCNLAVFVTLKLDKVLQIRQDSNRLDGYSPSVIEIPPLDAADVSCRREAKLALDAETALDVGDESSFS